MIKKPGLTAEEYAVIDELVRLGEQQTDTLAGILKQAGIPANQFLAALRA